MLLVVGLGNVGTQYDGTYHNVGFSVADKLAERLGLTFRENAGIRAYEAEGNVGGKKIRILKPTTYMNLSGECVKSAIAKYRPESKDVLIVLDDIDLPIGATRLRERGSGGTHNGLRNITALCGELPRLRVGIGKPHPGEDLASYVLRKAGKEASTLLASAAEKAAKGIEKYLTDGDRDSFSREMNNNA